MTDYTCIAPPRISVETFRGHLRRCASPALSSASDLYERCISFGIDPAVAVGFFHHESECGKWGRASGVYPDGTVTGFDGTRSWGNLRWHDVYGSLPYRPWAIDGFVAYYAFTDALDHFCRHLLGRDGTNNYAGLATVGQVTPVWAPRTDRNDPEQYARAVNGLVDSLRTEEGQTVTKPRVLICAGHVNIGNITADRIGQASADALRTGTGASGEVAWNGWFAGMLRDALNATGLVEAKATDATYSAALYVDWAPNLVLWSHFHRDADAERAIFSAPDATVFAGLLDIGESERMRDRLIGGYEANTGIPVTEGYENPNTRQFYGFHYPEPSSAVVLAEWGNANVDTVTLFNESIAMGIVRYTRDCTLEHLNLTAPTTPPPTQREDDTPPPAPTPRTKTVILIEIRQRLDELEALP